MFTIKVCHGLASSPAGRYRQDDQTRRILGRRKAETQMPTATEEAQQSNVAIHRLVEMG